jgi:hypothetical protein
MHKWEDMPACRSLLASAYFTFETIDRTSVKFIIEGLQ